MPESGQLAVTLHDGTFWEKSVSAKAVTLLLLNLLQYDFRINESFVFRMLGIDMKERRRVDNVPQLKDPNTQQYRTINRAIAMELLSSLLLCHIDLASEVRAMCMLKHGLPHKTAKDGTGDIIVRYEHPDGTLAFRIVAEVSSQKEVTEKFYFRQLNQAWKFATELSKDEEDGLVYGILINRGAIGSDSTLRGWYRDFAQEKEIGLDSNVRVLPLYAGDVASAALRILEEQPEGGLQFSAGILGGILDSLINMLLPRIETFVGDDWMRDKFVEMVAEGETVDPAGHHDPN